MSVSVRIPTPLRKVTNGEDKADVDGNTVSAIITSLDSQFPGIKVDYAMIVVTYEVL